MSECHTILFAAAEKLGRRIHIVKIEGAETVQFIDSQPAPSQEDWDEAITAVKTRKTITAAKFAELFTDMEKHEIYRRASLSVNSSAIAPQFAKLQYRFMQLEYVRSDAAELVQVLDLLEQTAVITNARRLRIAAFLPPEV